MAAKTPVTDPSTAGFVDPHRGLSAGAAGSTSVVAGREGMRLQVFYFADIDNLDTWASGIQQIRAVSFQPEAAATDLVAPALTNQASGQVTFIATNSDSSGWLWVLSGGSG